MIRILVTGVGWFVILVGIAVGIGLALDSWDMRRQRRRIPPEPTGEEMEAFTQRFFIHSSDLFPSHWAIVHNERLLSTELLSAYRNVWFSHTRQRPLDEVGRWADEVRHWRHIPL